jgi:hypothetical protein
MKRIAPFVFIAFTAIGLLGTPSTAFSQALPVVWDHTYGGAERDYANSIVALSDGGFAVAGRTSSKGAGGGDMWVLRLDEAGNVAWDHTYGGAKWDETSSIVALADGGFAVAGGTYSKGAGYEDMWVLRLDEAGNVVWDHTYGGASVDQANSIVALADGGFAVAGYTRSKGAGEGDMWVLRLDEAGNVLWDHTYGGAESDGAGSIVALADGGFAVAGYAESKGGGYEDMWVLRLDEAGNVVWDNTYGGADTDRANSIVALADGGFAVAGSTKSKGAGWNDMWVLRLDEAGNTAFAQALPMVNDTAIPLMVPNAGQILMSFPICSFSGHFGPWGEKCESSSETEKTAVRLYIDQSIEKIELNADNASIETDVWYYSIHSVKENDLGFTFNFVDKAKFGTYALANKFYVERDKVSLGWVIVGGELTYIDGADQQNIGKYFGFDIPVPLRVDE